MVVDTSEAEVGEGEAAEAVNGLVGAEGTRAHVIEQLAKRGLVHDRHYVPPGQKDDYLCIW